MDKHSITKVRTKAGIDGRDRRQAIAILKRNLSRYDDWIVVNLTLEALAVFARNSAPLRRKLIELLPEYTQNSRKSAASRARWILAELQGG